MRKSLFLTLVLSLCVADFGAFAANARGGRGTTATNNVAAAAPVAARAGARQKVVGNTAPSASAAAPVGGNVSARAGKKQTVKSAPTSSAAGKPMAARAGATQKVIQTGSKVAAATQNTTVPQECQDAYFGCMDSFCMLDNTSGGRCQCSDRNEELNKVLDEILKLDERSYTMATEGVERLQMGENADEIMARAKAAADQVINGEKVAAAAESKNKARKLDLSAWNTSVFSEEEEDIFEQLTTTETDNSLLSKTGDALHKASAKLCATQLPNQCTASGSMLQLMYAQKIKSDCSAYENSLKQQKTASQQKLQTAEKALRDTALEKFNEENKYDLGGCVREYTKCMENECGSDYSKCISFAAEENIKESKTASAGSKKAKTNAARTIKGIVDITLSGSTMTQLMGKKTMCDGDVLKYCKKYSSQVWDKYLANVAATLKSAETNAEDNLRQNCIKDTADCFRNSCAAQWNPEGDSAQYDMCLSDPMLVYDSCKIKVEACVVATGGTAGAQTEESLKKSRLWTGVTAMLSALRVDACTKEVKTCIEDICGKDYSGCVGLDTDSIGKLCPVQKLTACMTKFNENSVRDYIAEVAQGLAVQIDNSLAEVCQKAASDAVVKVCGDKDSCSTAVVDLDSLKSLISVNACVVNKNGEINTNNCKPNVSGFTEDEIYAFGYEIDWDNPQTKNRIKSVKQVHLEDSNPSYGVIATLDGMPDLSLITLEEEASGNNVKKLKFKNGGTNPGDSTAKVQTILNNALDNIMNSIDQDPKVTYCKTGRKIQGFKGLDKTDKDGNTIAAAGGDMDSFTGNNASKRFPKLTDEYRSIIASQLLTAVYAKKRELENSFNEKLVALDNQIAERYAQIAAQRGAEVEDAIDAYNLEKCTCNANKIGNESLGCYSAKDKNGMMASEGGTKGDATIARNYIRELTDKVGEYDSVTNTCTVKTINYKCDYYLSPSCRTFKEGVVTNTSQIKMSSFQK